MSADKKFIVTLHRHDGTSTDTLRVAPDAHTAVTAAVEPFNLEPDANGFVKGDEEYQQVTVKENPDTPYHHEETKQS